MSHFLSACIGRCFFYIRLMKKKLVLPLIGASLMMIMAFFYNNMAQANQTENRAEVAQNRVEPVLNEFLSACGARVGSPIFLRAVKEEDLLELWVKPDKSERYVLAKRYPIAAWSGELGPKMKEGDGQTPEGFYEVRVGALNPRSNYHLSFNIGYPNEYDREQGRTGSLIMIHGRDVSIGCLAMTDPGIEELYTMVAMAMKKGQKSIPVQIYPFIPTPARMAQEKQSPHIDFWRFLAKAWLWTEQHHAPAPVKIKDGQMVL